ncbi:MAG: hypothetical protein GY722_19500 [bacterium]|nr:hypothetical protein [bacterium]
MAMHDSDLVVETRKALGDIVDQAPMAPEWPEIELDRRRPYAVSFLGLRRGLAVAVGSAIGVVAVVGAVALFGGPAAEVQGDATTLGSTAPATTVVSVPLERVNLADQIAFVSAMSDSSPGFGVSNLVDRTYETAWSSVEGDAVSAELSFGFSEPVHIESIAIVSLQDETARLRRNRIKDFEIEYISDAGSTYVSSTAPDTSTPHVVEVNGGHLGLLVIHVKSVWPAETVGEQRPVKELAVAEVEFHGSPVPIDRDRIDEIRAVHYQLEAAIERLEVEIALLEQMTEDGSDGVADDLANRLAGVRALHMVMSQELAALQEQLDNAP